LGAPAMRLSIFAVFLALVFAACATRPPPYVIVPRAPVETRFEDWIEPLDVWQVVESQNGAADADLPEWVSLFYSRQITELESLEQFDGMYVFVARNQGANFRALRQWADHFSPTQDLAALVVGRVERRFAFGAHLYPDDQFGDFFMRVIRGVSNGEFPGAVVEETFWVMRERIPVELDDDGIYYWVPMDDDAPPRRFEYLALLSIDREILQRQIWSIMDAAETGLSVTAVQAAAIAAIRQDFFDGF